MAKLWRTVYYRLHLCKYCTQWHKIDLLFLVVKQWDNFPLLSCLCFLSLSLYEIMQHIVNNKSVQHRFTENNEHGYEPNNSITNSFHFHVMKVEKGLKILVLTYCVTHSEVMGQPQQKSILHIRSLKLWNEHVLQCGEAKVSVTFLFFIYFLLYNFCPCSCFHNQSWVVFFFDDCF